MASVYQKAGHAGVFLLGLEVVPKEKALHINALEAKACERGLRSVGKLLAYVVCWVDSLTFLGATLKGWSKDAVSNNAIAAIRQTAAQRRLKSERLETVIAYVTSKENPADGPSRGIAWDPEHLVRVPRGTIKFGHVD